MSRLCPNCSTAMVREVYHGVAVDVCPSCAGVWMHPDELRTLLAAGPDALEGLMHSAAIPVAHVTGGPSKLLCPDDGILLQQYHYMYSSPAILETCSRCGGFFIAESEMKKIEDAYREAHAPPSAKEEAGIELAAFETASICSAQREQAIWSLFTTLRHNVPGYTGLF